ncbi:P-selectin glycoprotein ligand 1 [Emydura macquarii macquarii]|uniref:P-selectin glycoprotein ligand 1 n=1 Tax=Emydura macquarii macquarii TaxID=1129001 RepID=UPI00352B855B
MALIWINLLLLLLSLLQAPAYKLPAVQLSGQDDAVRENPAAGRLPADGGAQPGSRGRSAWDAAGSGTADIPVFLRGKREAEEKPSNRSAEETTIIATTAGHPNTFPTAVSGQAWDENEFSPSPDLLDESTPQENSFDYTSFMAEPGSPATSDDISTEAAGGPAGSHLATSAKAAPTPGTSNVFSEAAIAGTEGMLPGGAESRENGSSIRSAVVKEPEVISPTSPPEPPRESSGISTKEPAPSRPGFVLGAGSSVTAKASTQKPPSHTNILVGKCLLALFILALVAGTFIVCTAVLASLLWRQKRIYQAQQRNHTEMVCISALLPDSEPVANGGQPSKIKRMKLPTDNGSETEGDNLTLSSFLPDH